MDRTFEIATHFGLSIREAEAAGWAALAVECAPCGTTTHISLWRLRQTSRVGFVQEVVGRMHCHACGAAPSASYLVREVKKPDPLKSLTYRVEEWSDGAVRPHQILAACHSVTVAHAAFDVDHKETPHRTLLLRQGTYVIRSTLRDPPPTNVLPMAPSRPVEDTVPLRMRRAK